MHHKEEIDSQLKGHGIR